MVTLYPPRWIWVHPTSFTHPPILTVISLEYPYQSRKMRRLVPQLVLHQLIATTIWELRVLRRKKGYASSSFSWTFFFSSLLNVSGFKYLSASVYAEIQSKDNHYEVIIYCPHTKNKDSIKKIMIFNKHLLIDIGERKYTYKFADDEEYTVSGLICAIISTTTKRCKRYSKMEC